MEGLVSSVGYVAHVFESAEGFLSSLRVDDTSCVITDVQMPGMNGFELQSELLARGLRMPIIFITAFPEQSGRERALAAGAFAYVEKPFDGRAMTSLLSKALGSPQD
jgi:FixJ family two-component response regulator